LAGLATFVQRGRGLANLQTIQSLNRKAANRIREKRRTRRLREFQTSDAEPRVSEAAISCGDERPS